MPDYTILYYEIYRCPKVPTENGRYYGKTPILEQAERIVREAKKKNDDMFIKCVCSDGKKRYLN